MLAVPAFLRRETFVSLGVVLGAMLIALVSARPYGGAWNDGSRLATVESLVDHHTLAIDRSIFVQVPREGSPYPSGSSPTAELLNKGTADKLWIDGHFYSDKSPVPALLMAVIYQFLQWSTGLTARVQPALFCYVMNVLSAGLAYVVAVWCVFRLGRPLQLPLPMGILLTVSFAMATVSVVYAQHVNNHILLLGVAAALILALAHLAEETQTPFVLWRRLFIVGSLTGLGYAIDLGAGPVLGVCTFAVVAWRCRRPLPVAIFIGGALPWVLLHHAVNFALGGTIQPANAVPEYFLWDGCPFTPENMTGVSNHSSIGRFLLYAAALLFGKHGFAGHNLPLFLIVPAMVALSRKRRRMQPEILFAFAWCGGTWLIYALTSTNYSGQCCSIRWFVPLLAPAYYVLAVFLRDMPAYRTDFVILSGFGAVLIAIAWWFGPWIPHMVPGYWPLQGAALASWLGFHLWRRLETPRLADSPWGLASLQWRR